MIYHYQTLHEYNKDATMAHTDGSTTKAKGKKVKAPKAKVKKNGNGSKTVTLMLDAGEAKVQSEETVSKAQFDALQQQMKEILAKFGPVLKAAESPPASSVVAVTEQVKQGLEALASQTVSVGDPPPTVLVHAVKPKKKYTKHPKATPVVEVPPGVVLDMKAVQVSVVPAEQSENPPFTPVITAQQVVESAPQMAGPAPGLMFGPDFAKGESKAIAVSPLAAGFVEKVKTSLDALAEQHKASIIAGGSSPFQMEKLPLVGPDGSVQIGPQTTPQGTGGDLLLTPDGTPALVDATQAVVEKVYDSMQVPAEYLGVTPPPPAAKPPKPKKKVPVQVQTTATVTKQFGKDSSKQEVTEETIAVHTFVTQPAIVGLECGLTMNLGNYESARITVSISVPCYAEERDAAFIEACKWVEERIVKQRDAITAAKNSTGF